MFVSVEFIRALTRCSPLSVLGNEDYELHIYVVIAEPVFLFLEPLRHFLNCKNVTRPNKTNLTYLQVNFDLILRHACIYLTSNVV